MNWTIQHGKDGLFYLMYQLSDIPQAFYMDEVLAIACKDLLNAADAYNMMNQKPSAQILQWRGK